MSRPEKLGDFICSPSMHSLFDASTLVHSHGAITDHLTSTPSQSPSSRGWNFTGLVRRDASRKVCEGPYSIKASIRRRTAMKMSPPKSLGGLDLIMRYEGYVDPCTHPIPSWIRLWPTVWPPCGTFFERCSDRDPRCHPTASELREWLTECEDVIVNKLEDKT